MAGGCWWPVAGPAPPRGARTLRTLERARDLALRTPRGRHDDVARGGGGPRRKPVGTAPDVVVVVVVVPRVPLTWQIYERVGPRCCASAMHLIHAAGRRGETDGHSRRRPAAETMSPTHIDRLLLALSICQPVRLDGAGASGPDRPGRGRSSEPGPGPTTTRYRRPPYTCRRQGGKATGHWRGAVCVQGGPGLMPSPGIVSSNLESGSV